MIERARTDEQTDGLRIAVGAATDAGGRAGNEDVVHVGTLAPLGAAAAGANGLGAAGYLLAVADGMGGHEHGEVASQIAIATVARMVEEDPATDPALLLRQAFRRANDTIYERAHGSGADETMGTTLVAALLRGKYATIASIGDSRAYLVRAEALTQITKDHSLVAEQVAQGALTTRQARQSPQRNILTQALGHRPKLDSKVPDIFELTLLPEDRLLLCTDGFYDVVEEQELVRITLDHDPEDAAKRLVDLAVTRGTTDNVSAVVAEAIPTRVPTVILQPAAAGGGRFGGNLAAILVATVIVVLVALVVLALLYVR